MAVNCLDTEAISNAVSGVIVVPESRSATPRVPAHTTLPAMPTAAEHPGLLFLMARSNTFRLRAACSAVVVADAVPDARVGNPVEVSTVTAVREHEHSSSTVTTAGTMRMR